jgi:hypothetical protein
MWLRTLAYDFLNRSYRLPQHITQYANAVPADARKTALATESRTILAIAPPESSLDILEVVV